MVISYEVEILCDIFDLEFFKEVILIIIYRISFRVKGDGERNRYTGVLIIRFYYCYYF